MDNFKYSRGFGYRNVNTNERRYPPGKRGPIFESWPLSAARWPRVPTEMAMIGYYRVKRWRLSVAFNYDPPGPDGDSSFSETVHLTNGATSEDDIITRGDVMQESPSITWPSPGRLFGSSGGAQACQYTDDEDDEFNGQPNGGNLLIALSFSAGYSQGQRFVLAGFAAPSAASLIEIATGKLIILGEEYTFPVFKSSTSTRIFTDVSAIFEPEEYWTYGGRFDPVTGI